MSVQSRNEFIKTKYENNNIQMMIINIIKYNKDSLRRE